MKWYKSPFLRWLLVPRADKSEAGSAADSPRSRPSVLSITSILHLRGHITHKIT